ncbi:MAG: HAD family phosphatase [Candidatus Thermoplasmatota archaeon]|nr:HAD family phosphatase [Candidatus Thermoplasmatota archaeon]
MFKGVVFDLDGTLIKWTNSWDVIRARLNLPSGYKELIKEMGYKEAKLRELEHWKKIGIKKDDVEKALETFELQEGVKELVPELSKKLATAIITGAPDVIALKVGRLLGIEEIYCNGIVLKNGYVDDFILEVNEESKGEKLREFAIKNGLKEKEIIAVGDAGNDISMFRAAGFSIAFNPKSERTAKEATIALNGDFTAIYEAIENALERR